MKYIMLITLFFIANASPAAVWEDKNSWDDSWEEKYKSWVKKNWDKKTFAKDTIYKGLLVDCADAVYSMRYIFAAENNLPFVIRDPTGGDLLISNQRSKWDDLPENKRKREFLKSLYGVVSTRSLPNDTYPVAVSRKTITSGALLRTDQDSHHSWTIKYMSDTGVPFLVFSSRPAKNIMLTRFEYPTTQFTFPNGLKPERNVGFMAFKQPADLLKNKSEIPGYSLEQYNIDIRSWAQTLQKKLALKDESLSEKAERIMISACDGSMERVEAVNDALNFLAKTGNQCMSAQKYDDYSTPSRDKRLKGSFDELEEIYQTAVAEDLAKTFNPDVWAQLSHIMKGTASDFCPIQISSNTILNLNQIYTGFVQGLISSNPHDPLSIRWGLSQGPSKLAASCPTY